MKLLVLKCLVHLQAQVREMIPTFVRQLQNPDIQNVVTNPNALSALQQIQQGLEQLRTSAPGLVNRYV